MARSPDIPFLRELRYRLEYIGLLILIGIVRLFPVDLGGSISAKFWRFFGKRIAGTNAR